MKITVIGAGAIGSAVANDLLAHSDVTQVQVCDAKGRSLQTLHDEVNNPRLRSFQVDARDPSVLQSILQGSDCVVGCAQPKMNPVLAELCLEMGIHYCDLGGDDQYVQQELMLDAQAREKNIWIMPNCGLDPGLVNILCMHGLSQFDEVETVHLRVGNVPLYPEPPFNFRISWSAEKVLNDYTHPVRFIEEGEVRDGEPLSHEEAILFPEPFGQMEAFRTAGGPSALIDNLGGAVRMLDHKLIRWPGHAAQMRFLLALGLGEERHIDVRTHLTYRDVLIRRMRQRLGGPYEDAVLLRVLLQGKQQGQARTLTYELIEHYDEETGISAVKRCTSIPTAAIALLIASGQVPGGGAAPPENVIPHQPFLDVITARGLDIQTSWHEGYVSVQEAQMAPAPM